MNATPRTPRKSPARPTGDKAGRRDSLRPHRANVARILQALRQAEFGTTRHMPGPAAAKFPAGTLAHYQRYLLERFGEVIAKPSFHYVSKTPGSWLIVGDRRREIAADIALIIERHGLGVGMLVLHLQQILTGHIPLAFPGGPGQATGAATEFVRGLYGEVVLSIPIRRHRADYAVLSAHDIVTPAAALDPGGIVSHERDGQPCFYCSAPQMYPREVLVDIDGHRHGLSRDYTLGFTYAPFGHPLKAVHFLAWDRAAHPLNMSRVPMTVSDLVELTAEVNRSIRTFFAAADVHDAPTIDGVSNAWAGNSIYHSHVQLFAPEHPSAILSTKPYRTEALVERDDVTIKRMIWPLPVYRVAAATARAAGVVGNDLTGLWRMAGGSRRVPYKTFKPGHRVAARDLVPVHTQNILVPGHGGGRSVFIVLRDRRLVDYVPEPGTRINPHRGLAAIEKRNLGVLEATGSLILDDADTFRSLRAWSRRDISLQIGFMLAAIAPDAAKVRKFETTARGLFPCA